MTGSWLNPETTSWSTSGYAWKGNYVKPTKNITIAALGAKGNWPQGITLKFGLFTVEANLIAQVVYKSPGVTLPPILDVNPSNSRIWEVLDPPWQLIADTEYLLMVGRSDGADNWPCSVSGPTVIQPAPFPSHQTTKGFGRVGKADPQVGDPVNTMGATAGLLATWSFT